MPNMNETVEVARKVLPVIFVVDTSGSMAGERISAVNEALKDSMDLLKNFSAENPDAEVQVGILKFSASAEWETKGIVGLEAVYWNDLFAAGSTQVAAALTELHDKLSRSAFLKSANGFNVPVIIFMSDGEPTDPGVWESTLEWVKNNNNWFKYATKIAIAIDDDADRDCLARLVGNKEAVVAIHDYDTLKVFIKAVTMTASKVNSVSRTSAGGISAADIIDMTKKQLDDPDSVEVGTGDSDYGGWDPQSSGVSSGSSDSFDTTWGDDEEFN